MENKDKEYSPNINDSEKYFELLRKKVNWEKYIYDTENIAKEKDIKLRLEALKKPIEVFIPTKNDIRYNHIRNFRNHNLSNNLALDMLIRNKEFSNYIYEFESVEYDLELNKEQKQEKKRILERNIREKFGLNSRDIFSLISNHPYINQNKDDYLDGLSNQSIELNPPYIFDIKNGINRVIDFYLKKNSYILLSRLNT